MLWCQCGGHHPDWNLKKSLSGWIANSFLITVEAFSALKVSRQLHRISTIEYRSHKQSSQPLIPTSESRVQEWDNRRQIVYPTGLESLWYCQYYLSLMLLEVMRQKALSKTNIIYYPRLTGSCWLPPVCRPWLVATYYWVERELNEAYLWRDTHSSQAMTMTHSNCISHTVYQQIWPIYLYNTQTNTHICIQTAWQ